MSLPSMQILNSSTRSIHPINSRPSGYKSTASMSPPQRGAMNIPGPPRDRREWHSHRAYPTIRPRSLSQEDSLDDIRSASSDESEISSPPLFGGWSWMNTTHNQVNIARSPPFGDKGFSPFEEKTFAEAKSPVTPSFPQPSNSLSSSLPHRESSARNSRIVEQPRHDVTDLVRGVGRLDVKGHPLMGAQVDGDKRRKPSFHYDDGVTFKVNFLPQTSSCHTEFTSSHEGRQDGFTFQPQIITTDLNGSLQSRRHSVSRPLRKTPVDRSISPSPAGISRSWQHSYSMARSPSNCRLSVGGFRHFRRASEGGQEYRKSDIFPWEDSESEDDVDMDQTNGTEPELSTSPATRHRSRAKTSNPRKSLKVQRETSPRSGRRLVPEPVSLTGLAQVTVSGQSVQPTPLQRRSSRVRVPVTLPGSDEERESISDLEIDDVEDSESPVTPPKARRPSTTKAAVPARTAKEKGPCAACQTPKDSCMRKGYDWPFEDGGRRIDSHGRAYVNLCNKCGLRWDKSAHSICHNCKWILCKEERAKALSCIDTMKRKSDKRLSNDDEIEGFVCSPKYWKCGCRWKVGWVKPY
ncbi:hypothetical protein BZG36_02048 [Bifiguratus adelaidae]|uniref:Uncharacterized protein n=1 Tax=Bifiguratus adelaidae TaxID=1938954 RepID=A0A261Y1W7_9FUNG|nr:hypothetical protein BZG36_02048 [Bifiguratus adelaidae]